MLAEAEEKAEARGREARKRLSIITVCPMRSKADVVAGRRCESGATNWKPRWQNFRQKPGGCH